MRFSYLFFLVLSIVFLFSCENKNTYTIEGKIKGLESSELYIVTKQNPSLIIDTIQAKDGKFNFEASSDSLKPVIIYMEKGSVWITVWAQNSDKITLAGDAHYPELMVVKGGEVNNLLSEFKEDNKDIIKERIE